MASFAMRSFLAGIFLLALGMVSQAAAIKGPARAIDCDMLEVQGERVRLHRMERTRRASLQEERIGHC